jgi:cytoskeletal protein CcmA (bactofilin family)
MIGKHRTGSSVTSSIACSHAIVDLAKFGRYQAEALHGKLKGMPQPTSQPSDSQKSQLNPHSTLERSTIGHTLVVKGEVSGAESLYVDGRIEGTVDFVGHVVTVGSKGRVAATINAREVVILGTVQGNIECTDRLDLRSQGSLSGDVVTQRISVEDGAILKGGVQVRAVEQKTDKSQLPKAKQASA